MANPDGQGHLLSLKVMRVSRPGLASAWEPFYSSSSSFSAHSTASVLSLQGKAPLPGHPKTLRDLTHVSEFLTLPTAFGAIQLGETFSSCLCVNNESNADVEGVGVKVEMQTSNSKTLLAEVGGEDRTLAAGEGFEFVVHHEVKELGQHVLGCTVSYRLPSGLRRAPGSVEGSTDPSLQGFRKYYKFAAANPLSVKTKVHAPRSPSALFDPLERGKVFLEVHIQNMMQDPMWIERMDFECADGWNALDANRIRGSTPSETVPLFSGSMSLFQPHTVRQYTYILSPTTVPTFFVPPQSGSSVPLGRLDISWRTQFGEPGRLLTSTLYRRIPAPSAPAQAPAPTPTPAPPLPVIHQPLSAIPPYLQRVSTPSSSPRSHPSQLPPSRPISPSSGTHRPGSPFHNRAMPVLRPQSPASSIASLPPARPSHSIPKQTCDIDVNLAVTRRIEPVHVNEPFEMEFKLTISAALSRDTPAQDVSIAIQHLQSPTTEELSDTLVPITSPRPGHLLSSTVPFSAEERSPLSLPPPYFETADQTRDAKLKGCTFLGPSVMNLEPIKLDASHLEDADSRKAEGSQRFELTFLALQSGYVCVGGLRILLMDRKSRDTEMASCSVAEEAKILKEFDVVGEIWVSS